MNRVNPLYILALFFSCLIISFFVLNSQSNSFIDKNIEFNNVKKSASQYKDLNSNWNNRKFVLRTLNNILNNKMFKNQKILRVNTKNSVKVKLESANQKILNRLLNNVLNKKLIIRKLSLEKTSISLEIGIDNE